MHGAALVLHFEHLRPETLAVALIARHEHVREELHLDADLPFALARLAAAARHVEREVARREPAQPRVLRRREQVADRIERLQIGDRIGARRAADRLLVDQHHVTDELGAFETVEPAHAPVPITLGPLDRRVDHVVHERRLARAADARHHREQAERDVDVGALEIVLLRADHLQHLLRVRLAPRGRNRDREVVAHVLRGQRPRLAQQPLETARVDDAPALLAGAEPEIDHLVGDANHVGVVFDDEHGVALVAELPKDVDQAEVVARVEADRRLVEDVERADQRGAERGGQTDALGLAAGERRRQAVERQVGEADVFEECQPPRDLAEHLFSDRFFTIGELDRREVFANIADGEAAYTIDRVSADLHVARFAAQARAVAVRAGLIPAVAAQEYPDVHLVFLAFEPLEEAVDAFVGVAVAVKDDAALLVGELVPGHVEADVGGLRGALERGEVRPVVRLAPRLDRVLLDRLLLIGDDQVEVELHHVAEAVTGRARAERVVEREQPRLRQLVEDAAGAALEAFAEDVADRLAPRRRPSPSPEAGSSIANAAPPPSR